MAKATATCVCKKCGKEFVKSAYNFSNRRAADEWEAWAVDNFTLCPDCEAEAAQEKAASKGFPELVGSPKQITWANKIRNQFAADCEKDLKEIDPAGLDMFKEFIQKILKTKTSASWWIEHKSNHMAMLDRIASEEMN